jgi:hypothetical protein
MRIAASGDLRGQIWGHPILLIWGCPTTFVLWKFLSEASLTLIWPFWDFVGRPWWPRIRPWTGPKPPQGPGGRLRKAAGRWDRRPGRSLDSNRQTTWQIYIKRFAFLSRPCLGPPDPWFRVKARCRRSRPDQVDYWEGLLHLLYNKMCLKTIDHGSRSTWGPGPSRSRFRAQKYDRPPLKQTFPTTFVL